MTNQERIASHNILIDEAIEKANSLPDAGGEQVTPEITVNSNGLITATAGTKSATKQLTVQGAQTIIPTTTDQTITSGKYLTGAQTIKGDINLKAENIVKDKVIFGITGTAEAGSGGGSEVEDAMVTGTLTTYTNDRVTTIASYAFAYCSSLTSVSFPECTHIYMNAFAYCSSLTSVNFPECTHINNDAFRNCTSLTSVSFPKVTHIYTYAFRSCYSLTSVNFPECIHIYNDAFRNCTSLTSVNFPKCTSIGSYAFAYCTSLTSVNFPKCTSIGSYAFAYCRTLSSLTLGASTICTLSNSNAFASTPFAGYSIYFSGTPVIYVPASLLTAYQTATNWTYFSSYFKAIEGTDVGSGGTDVGSGEIITFTIDGTTYQAEEGMTWSQWCNSVYNTDDYGVDNNSHVITNEFEYVAIGSGNYVVGTQTIIASQDYIIDSGWI